VQPCVARACAGKPVQNYRYVVELHDIDGYNVSNILAAILRRTISDLNDFARGTASSERLEWPGRAARRKVLPLGRASAAGHLHCSDRASLLIHI
jgi:hypothetical protein